MREGRAPAEELHTWGPRKGKGWWLETRLIPGSFLAQAFCAFIQPIHPHGEIQEAKKSLLCKGCGLEFSDASGTAGSSEGAEESKN